MKSVAGLLLLLWVALSGTEARAGVFKCKGEDGSTIYSQTPCVSTVSEKVSVGVPKKIPAEVCGLAHDFGLETADRMRNGASATSEKTHLPGRFAASKAAASIIDYVFGFAGEPDVSAGRIASLTMAKCSNGGFGDVTAADIPHRDPVEQLQHEQNERYEAAQQDAEMRMLQQEAEAAASQPSFPSAAPGATASDPNEAACADAKTQLDRLDDSMRAGYTSSQGDRFRERRKALRKRIRDACN